MTKPQDMPERIWAFATYNEFEGTHYYILPADHANPKPATQYTRTDTVQAKLAATEGLVGALEDIKHHTDCTRLQNKIIDEALAAYEGLG